MPTKTKQQHKPQRRRARAASDPHFDALVESISALAKSVQALHQQAVREYTPLVEAIVGSGSRDIYDIEHTLDGLLDFCDYEPALLLYKRLCRHYWETDPVATASYVYAYRDLWDADKDEESKPVSKAPARGRKKRARPSRRG